MRKHTGKIANPKEARRYRRKLSIRKKVSGTPEIPRLSTQKSAKHLSIQVIDDENSKTLFSVQTFGKNAVPNAKANKDGAKLVGEKVASLLKEKNLSRAVFDRSGYKYHGVIATLVESIRENGIQI